MRTFLTLFAAVLLVGMTLPARAGEADDRENARRAAAVLATHPAIRDQARLPEIKVLQIVGKDTVRVRTDNVMLDRLHGDNLIDDRHYIDGSNGAVKENPQARPPDELTFTVGETCQVGQANVFHKLLLLKVEGGKAVFQWQGWLRNGKQEACVAVAPYEDARWQTDPKDRRRVTYTEFDEKGRKKQTKQYRDGRLDGAWTTWYPGGGIASEYHFRQDRREGAWREWYPNGRMRYQAFYRDGRLTGHETWWHDDGSEAGFGDHP